MMELVTPGAGLIVWQTLTLLYIGGFILALIDILRNNFKDSVQKLIWVLVVLLVPIIGVILYFSIGRKQKMNV